jgi:hypothetical protein
MPTWVWNALTAVRRVPWRKVVAAIIWLATSGREYWNRLSREERRELWELVAKSRGKRSNLSPSEQGRVIELLDKVRRGSEGPDAGTQPA